MHQPQRKGSGGRGGLGPKSLCTENGPTRGRAVLEGEDAEGRCHDSGYRRLDSGFRSRAGGCKTVGGRCWGMGGGGGVEVVAAELTVISKQKRGGGGYRVALGSKGVTHMKGSAITATLRQCSPQCECISKQDLVGPPMRKTAQCHTQTTQHITEMVNDNAKINPIVQAKGGVHGKKGETEVKVCLGGGGGSDAAALLAIGGVNRQSSTPSIFLTSPRGPPFFLHWPVWPMDCPPASASGSGPAPRASPGPQPPAPASVPSPVPAPLPLPLPPHPPSMLLPPRHCPSPPAPDSGAHLSSTTFIIATGRTETAQPKCSGYPDKMRQSRGLPSDPRVCGMNP